MKLVDPSFQIAASYNPIVIPIKNVIKVIHSFFCIHSLQEGQFRLNLGLKSMENEKMDNIFRDNES